MPIDAGTIYSSIRVRLDKLNSDINGAVNKFNALSESIEASNKKFERLEKFGQKMTMNVTLPILAAGAASVKFASDFNESVGGVETVFGKFAKTVTDFASTAAENAGLSMTEVNEAATVLGASLQNANYTMEESAELTVKLTQRAADMAAMFGTSTTQSLDAIKAALRGEADPIEKFGVGLTEATINAKAMELGLKKTNGQLDAHQKAQARLAVILDQTARAEGRFAAEADSVGGKTKITTAQVKNMAITLGQDLLPLASEIIGTLSNSVKFFNELNPEAKKTLITVAGFVATIGPLSTMISKTAGAVNILKTAFAALSASPALIALAAIAGAVLALKEMGDANNERMLKDVAENFKDIGIEAEKIVKIEEAIALSSRMNASFVELQAKTKQIAEDLVLTEDQVISIGINSEKTTQFTKDQLTAIQKINQAEKIRLSYIPGTVEWKEREKKLAETIVETSTEETDQVKKRKAAEAEYNKELKTTAWYLSQNVITQSEAYVENIASARKYIDTLYDLGYASKTETGTVGYNALNNLLIMYPQLQRAADAYESSLEEVGVETAKEAGYVDRLTLGMQNYQKALEDSKKHTIDWKAVQENALISAIGGFDTLGEAIGNGTLDFGTFAKAGMQSLGAIISSIGDAILGWAAYHIAELGIWNPLAWSQFGWSIAQAAVIKTAGAAVSAYAGTFEDGGVVPGRSFTGDNMIARVNSKERIYTNEQDQKINDVFDALQNGTLGGQPQTVNLVVSGKKLASVVVGQTRNRKVK